MPQARRGGVRDEIVVAVASYVTQPEFCLAPFGGARRDAVPGLERADLTVAGGAYAHEFCCRALVEHRDACAVRAPAAAPAPRGRASTTARRPSRRSAPIGSTSRSCASTRSTAAPRWISSPTSGGPRGAFAPLHSSSRACPATSPKRPMRSSASRRGEWRPGVTDYYRYALTRPEVDGLLCALHEERHVAELGEALARGAARRARHSGTSRISPTSPSPARRRARLSARHRMSGRGDGDRPVPCCAHRGALAPGEGWGRRSTTPRPVGPRGAWLRGDRSGRSSRSSARGQRAR